MSSRLYYNKTLKLKKNDTDMHERKETFDADKTDDAFLT